MTQKEQQKAWRDACTQLMWGVRENLDKKINAMYKTNYTRARKDALRNARKLLARLNPVYWEKFLAYTQNWTGELHEDFLEITTVGGDRTYMEVLWK